MLVSIEFDDLNRSNKSHIYIQMITLFFNIYIALMVIRVCGSKAMWSINGPYKKKERSRRQRSKLKYALTLDLVDNQKLGGRFVKKEWAWREMLKRLVLYFRYVKHNRRFGRVVKACAC